MKIGIVTVHDSSNLGSFLQALGMQEIIRRNGDEPYFIKTRSKFTTLCLFLGYDNAPQVRTVKSFLKFLVSCVKHADKTIEKYKKYRIYKRDWNAYEKVISVKEAKKLGIDILLLGSDEIWNASKPVFQNPLFYGIGMPASKKVGFAVSVGALNIDDWNQFPILLQGIKELDDILVRDDYSRNVLEHYGVHIADRICDPTLQVKICDYMRKDEEVELPEEDYLAVYSYSVLQQERILIQNFATKHHLKTVAISLPQSWCDKYVNCSPLEFGAILKKAKYVYTSTFHGTIFSALYHTRFAVSAVLPKVIDIINVLGLECNIIPEECDDKKFEEIMLQTRNYDLVEACIKKMNSESAILYQKYVKQNSNQ